MASMTDLETALIIGFCVVGGAILLFLIIFVTFCTIRTLRSRKQSETSDYEAKSSRVKKKLAPLPDVPSSTSMPAPPATPSTTTENLSGISSPASSPRAQQQSPDPITPVQSLVFPSAHSKYAGMRVGRAAWTSAYLPSEPQPGGLEGGAAALEQRLDAYAGSEQYRTRSSTGFEPPILEGISTSDPYIARAHTGGHHRAPPSDRGSQTKLLGAAVEPATHDHGEAFRQHAGHPSRMWPSRAAYGPYSPAAMAAGRRRTQDLYYARRGQAAASPPSPVNEALSRPTTGRELIWSRTSGRPQTGSYVIGPYGVDEASSTNYQPSMGGGSGYQPSPDGGESSIYLPAEPEPDRPHRMIVEATIESQSSSSPADGPGERHLIGDAFRFLDEFEE